MNELISADFVILIERDSLDVAFCHLKVARAFCQCSIKRSHLAPESFSEVLETGSDHQATLRESRLGTSIYYLKEKLTHCSIDGVAHKVGIERLKNGLARKNL